MGRFWDGFGTVGKKSFLFGTVGTVVGRFWDGFGRVWYVYVLKVRCFGAVWVVCVSVVSIHIVNCRNMYVLVSVVYVLIHYLT